MGYKEFEWRDDDDGRLDLMVALLKGERLAYKRLLISNSGSHGTHISLWWWEIFTTERHCSCDYITTRFTEVTSVYDTGKERFQG